MRLLAISDIHIDFRENFEAFFQYLAAEDYSGDALILAGDISDDVAKVRTALEAARDAFGQVFFTPGNHDLWVRRETYPDSVTKFQAMMDLCRKLDVKTGPAKLGAGDEGPVWVAPLHSWYVMPEEAEDGLYVEIQDDAGIEAWSDHYFIRWPQWNGFRTAAEFFLSQNDDALGQAYDAPVVTFSHFLPRREVMRPDASEFPGLSDPPTAEELARLRRNGRRHFNFSRVAGCVGIERQLRKIEPQVHVYGHQHRNRRRVFDGVVYWSNCLGYPEERKQGALKVPERGFVEVWNTGAG